MRLLLIILVLFLTASAVFGFDPGPLPGIKIKNGLLYLIVLGLMLRLTLDRSYRGSQQAHSKQTDPVRR